MLRELKLLRRFLMILTLVSLSFFGMHQAVASEEEISFEADSVTVSQEDGSMYATGNVVMSQAGLRLTADEVRYNRDSDSAVASGNVEFIDADGAVHRADVMTLDTEFTHIVAETLRSRYPDGSFVTAENGDIRTESVSIFNSSRFSPCDCDFENGETPIWDMRASSTRHNVETKTIIHRNVRMHIMNVPIGYLPYLAHPDWTVRRRSGFLTPSFVVSSDLGFTASIPYYHVIDDTSDVELTPYRFQYRGAALRTKYRQRWDNSDLDVAVIAASVNTYKKEREAVGAIDANYRTTIGDDWRVNARLHRASQDTFLRRYKFESEKRLKSEVTAERIKSNRYYRVEMSDIQGLNAADTPDKEPTILPHIFYEKVGPGFREGQRLKTEISAIQVDNDDGHDLSRWTGNVQVEEQITKGPHHTSATLGAIGSYYSIQKKPVGATTRTDDLGRLTPVGSLNWRYPFSVSAGGRSAIVEPQAQMVYIGGDDKSDKIPNRDSSDYRIDEANLFLINRYQGYDYLRPGTRADVGISAVANDAVLGEVSGFAGISRRMSGKPSTGLAVNDEDIYSDYVASLSVDPEGPFKVTWSGRLASHDFKLNESKTNVSSQFRRLSYSLEHLQVAQPYFSSATSDLEELKASFAYDLTGGWRLKGSQVWNLSNGKSVRDTSTASLTWTGGIQNCLTVNFDYDRDLEKDRDIKANDTFLITVNFKYLGAITQRDFDDSSN